MGATRKKYIDLGSHYVFKPPAVETLGVFITSACQLLNYLGKRISLNTRDARDKLLILKDLNLPTPLIAWICFFYFLYFSY